MEASVRVVIADEAGPHALGCAKLGLHTRFENSQTRKALGMDFIPLSASAPAMARSLIALGLV